MTETKAIHALLTSEYRNYIFIKPLYCDVGIDGSCKVFVTCVMLNERDNTLRSNSPPTGSNHTVITVPRMSPLKQVARNCHGARSLNPGGVRHGSPKSGDASECVLKSGGVRGSPKSAAVKE